MIKKTSVLRFFIVVAVLAAVLSLCACGKTVAEGNAGSNGSQTSKDENVPDNVVPPITQGAQPDATEPADTTEPVEPLPNGDDPSRENGDDDNADDPDDRPEKGDQSEDSETLAMKYLSLLNSSKVHVKLIEVFSYDGENVFSIERETFIDGSSRIYINDAVKTLIRDGVVTVVDYDDGIYYSYPDDGGYGLIFGYEPDKYLLISTEQTDSGFAEIYTIAGENMTSTWTFGSDKSIQRVADRSLDEGYFVYYTFDIIESDVSGMDFTIPDGFTEADPDDYEFYI